MSNVAVTLRKREHIDKALRRLKRSMDKEGVLTEVKDRQYFQKPGDKKRKKSARAQARRRKEEKLAQSQGL